MKDVANRIELLLLTMIVVASCLVIPAARPRVSLQHAAIGAIDSTIHLREECGPNLVEESSSGARYDSLFEKYKRRLYSEEAGSSVDEKWSAISPVSVLLILELQSRVQPTWVRYHDAWDDDPEGQFSSCIGYMKRLQKSTADLLRAYYYTGSSSPESTLLVDLDSKFNASIRIPYIDGAFSLDVVMRVVFTIVSVVVAYIIVLLRSITRIRKRQVRWNFGALIFAQPGIGAGILSIILVLGPAVTYTYLVAVGISDSIETRTFAALIVAQTIWLTWEVYRFRLRTLDHVRVR